VAGVSSLLEREIAEQASVLAARASAGWGPASEAAALLGGCGDLVVAARGSSDNAARFAQYLFGDELRLQVGLAAPWLYRDVARAPRLGDAVVMAISQSGRSPDIVAVLAAARDQGRPTIAVTNDVDSELALVADVVVPLLAGEERSVAATKSYLASLHALVQIVECMSPDGERRSWLERLPAAVDAMAGSALARRSEFDALLQATPITVTGRGLFFSAACETALKVRELSGIPAEAFSPPDLMHGPIAALHSPAGTWLIAPGADELAAVVQRVDPGVIVSGDEGALTRARVAFVLPAGVPDWVGSILSVVPAQAAGLRLAERGGSDVDHPHGLHKVTLTN
jgi:glucosamine--fructose-6-phosphate aminotransferase (isomerizing)